jgi:hypothetical protein
MTSKKQQQPEPVTLSAEQRAMSPAADLPADAQWPDQADEQKSERLVEPADETENA